MNKITTDLLFFSHYRWDFAFRRPQHLAGQFAKHRRVFFIEDPIIGVSKIPLTLTKETDENVQVIVPYLPGDFSPFEQKASLQELIDKVLKDEHITDFSLIYNSPKALGYTRHLKPMATIYDCVSDYSTHILGEVEKELMNTAELILTNGQSLYSKKGPTHSNVQLIPNSVDYRHFFSTRVDPSQDDSTVRVGFFGVIDDNIDLSLIEKIALLKPEWEFIIIGPLLSVPEKLPTAENIRFMGPKDYEKLPEYFSTWACAFLPYKVNERTTYQIPEETLQFLSAGVPVVASPLQDLIQVYGDKNILSFATTPEEFISKVESSLSLKTSREWLEKLDSFLEGMSWENTAKRISDFEKEVYEKKGLATHLWTKSGLSKIDENSILYSLLSSEKA